MIRCVFDGFVELVCCPIKPPNEIRTSENGNKNRDNQFIVAGIPTKETLRKVEDACALSNRLAKQFPSPQIVNGEDARLGEFPSMAALGVIDFETKKKTFVCGGTILNERYVLTTAHCLVRQIDRRIEFVRIGAANLTSDEGKDYTIEDYIVNLNYNIRTKFNDIALIRLKEPIQVSNVSQFSCLPKSPENPEEKMLAIGWGKTDPRGLLGSELLQKLPMEPYDNKRCGDNLGKTLSFSQMCAYDPQRNGDTCQGDSGGPLLYQYYENEVTTILGITSYGQGCGIYPGVYTKVYFFLNWIMGNIRE